MLLTTQLHSPNEQHNTVVCKVIISLRSIRRSNNSVSDYFRVISFCCWKMQIHSIKVLEIQRDDDALRNLDVTKILPKQKLNTSTYLYFEQIRYSITKTWLNCISRRCPLLRLSKERERMSLRGLAPAVRLATASGLSAVEWPAIRSAECSPLFC